MRKLTTVGLLLLVFVGLATGQVTLSLPTQTAANGTALALPVQVTGFNHVGSFSLTISFDKNALTYTGIQDQPTFGIFNSTPTTTANTTGNVIVSWFNVSPALNIGSGTLLNLKFTYNTGSSALTFINTTPSSITDSIGNNLTATYTNGQVSGLPSRISLNTVVSSPGPVFASLTGDNLKGLGSMSLRIAYDTASVTFVGLVNPALVFQAGTPSPGVLALSWFSTTPFSLNTGKLADLQFTLKKDSTNLTFQGTSQVTDSVGNNVTITYVNGKIAKTPAPPLPPVGFTLPTLKAVPGKDVRIPVTVTRMNSIGSVSMKINYDQTKLTFKSIANFPGTGYVTNATGGVLSFAWFGIPYLNIGTGKLMDLVFGYTGGSSVVSFNSAQSQVTDSVANTLSLTFGNGVVNQDSVPHFTPIPAKSLAQGDSISFAVLATDADAGDTLTYSAGTLPTGATFTALTKTFFWKPGYPTVKTYNIWFYVSDQVGAMDSTMAAVSVTITHRKPALNSQTPAKGTATVSQNVATTFSVDATDLDGGGLAYTWYLNDAWVLGPGSRSSYIYTSLEAHGTAKKLTCVFASAFGMKDSASWSFTITGISKDAPIPTEFALGQNYPNPFNPTTTILFDLPKEAPVTMEIYNVLGIRIRTLLNGQTINAGRHQIVWDGRDENGSVAPTGVYLYRISAGDFRASKKMTLLK